MTKKTYMLGNERQGQLRVQTPLRFQGHIVEGFRFEAEFSLIASPKNT